MSKNDEIPEKYSASAIISKVFAQIEPGLLHGADAVSNAWYETVSSIKSFSQDDTQRVQLGSQLADHSTVLDLKNNTLVVETDHPANLQLFQMYRKYILEGLHRKLPELEIRNVTYKIK